MSSDGQGALPNLGADRLEELYANRFSADERRRKTAVWRVLCEEFLQRYVRPDAVVLDLGAGYCDFVNHIRAARRIAVDLNPETPLHAARGVEVRSLALTDVAASLGVPRISRSLAARGCHSRVASPMKMNSRSKWSRPSIAISASGSGG